MKKKNALLIGVIIVLLLVIVGLFLVIDPIGFRNKDTKSTSNKTTKTETKEVKEKKEEKKTTESDKKTTEETKKSNESSNNNGSSNTNSSDNNTSNTKTKVDDAEIVGKWSTVKAVNSEDATEITNLKELFGSSYNEYGSYLELKEDGTFVDGIEPTTRSDKSTTGTYTIEKNYNKQGDCYIFLEYSDGSKDQLKRLYLDESGTPYLALDRLVHDYKLYLKK